MANLGQVTQLCIVPSPSSGGAASRAARISLPIVRGSPTASRDRPPSRYERITSKTGEVLCTRADRSGNSAKSPIVSGVNRGAGTIFSPDSSGAEFHWGFRASVELLMTKIGDSEGAGLDCRDE